MGLVADTSAIVAAYDADDRHHLAVRTVLESESGPIVVPSVILAEIDYMLRRFLGIDAELDFLAALQSGSFTVEPFTIEDLTRSLSLIERHRSADLGLADAAVAAIAERLRIRRILTLDERDFRMMRTRRGEPFVILPADQD
ncbi:MAG: PIN domain-containing protein [Acidobacteria bacterium]|nr:PIN domain-containing protein [Acidobacteriota bacterium]